MNWVYAVSEANTRLTNITIKVDFADYLRDNGYVVRGLSTPYPALIIDEVPDKRELSYEVGDIIYFMSYAETNMLAPRWRYIVDMPEFAAWQIMKNQEDKLKIMYFKDLIVGDVFTLATNCNYKFIKISTINDNVDVRCFNHCECPSNVLILDSEHYGIISPRAKVKIIKHYSGQESEDSITPKYCQQNDKYDYKVLLNHLSCDWSNYNILDIEKYILTKKVIFNDPATIVYWLDGTKTVVKCQGGEKFDKEKGLALCFLKKIMGNKGNYNNRMKKIIDNARSDKNE